MADNEDSEYVIVDQCDPVSQYDPISQCSQCTQDLRQLNEMLVNKCLECRERCCHECIPDPAKPCNSCRQKKSQAVGGTTEKRLRDAMMETWSTDLKDVMELAASSSASSSSVAAPKTVIGPTAISSGVAAAKTVIECLDIAANCLSSGSLKKMILELTWRYREELTNQQRKGQHVTWPCSHWLLFFIEHFIPSQPTTIHFAREEDLLQLVQVIDSTKLEVKENVKISGVLVKDLCLAKGDIIFPPREKREALESAAKTFSGMSSLVPLDLEVHRSAVDLVSRECGPNSGFKFSEGEVIRALDLLGSKGRNWNTEFRLTVKNIVARSIKGFDSKFFTMHALSLIVYLSIIQKDATDTIWEAITVKLGENDQVLDELYNVAALCWERTLDEETGNKIGVSRDALIEWATKNGQKTRLDACNEMRTHIKEFNDALKEAGHTYKKPVNFPLKPGCKITGVLPGAKEMESNARPVRFKVVLREPGTCADREQNVLLKREDDIRKEKQVSDIVGKMSEQILGDPEFRRHLEKHLKNAGKFHLGHYRIDLLRYNVGLVEMVEDASTLQVVYTKFDDPMTFLFRSPGKENSNLRDSKITYVISLAAWTVMSHVLGLGDRHQENFLLTKDGVFFHIDFGYVLGADVNVLLTLQNARFDLQAVRKMERSNEYQMEPLFFETLRYVYRILRRQIRVYVAMLKHAALFDANIQTRKTDSEVVRFVDEKFMTHLTSHEAEELFIKEVQKDPLGFKNLVSFVRDQVHEKKKHVEKAACQMNKTCWAIVQGCASDIHRASHNAVGTKWQRANNCHICNALVVGADGPDNRRHHCVDCGCTTCSRSDCVVLSHKVCKNCKGNKRR